ncbi:MAG: hypothetical protein ACRERR_09455 [Moraxellaceae bacterium]
MRIFLALLIMLTACASPARAQEASPDTVAVYLVPMEDFPEAVAAKLARQLSDDMKLWVKATVRMGKLDVLKLPGTNQFIAEDILAKAQPIIRSLPEASRQTYYVLLTTRDINSSSGNFRFQFSMHVREARSSVVSIFRMLEFHNGRYFATQRSYERLLKMTKRGIGEIYLGWERSSNRGDIMYSPIMSVQDLDSIGLQHDEKRPQMNIRIEPLRNSI